MPKYFESETIFNFNWDQVAQAFWRRYPNPFSGHVISEDTLSQEVINGRLHTRRLLTKTNLVPKWGARFVHAPFVKIYEESVVDPATKTLVTYTYNMGYSKVMSIVEKVVYKTSENNSSQTIAARSAWVDSQVYGFSRAIRAFGVERFRNNCAKAVGGYNHVLHMMFPQKAHLTEPNAVHINTTSVSRIKEAAKNASEKAKAKADDIYHLATTPQGQSP